MSNEADFLFADSVLIELLLDNGKLGPSTSVGNERNVEDER